MATDRSTLVILKYAGRDATTAYSEVHAPSVIQTHLPPDRYMGTLDELTITDEWVKQPPTENPQVLLEHEKPPLHTLINSHDFEVVASKTASKKTWAFYSSAATDLLTRNANKSCFDRIWLRPRVLRNVRSVDASTQLLGVDSRLPLFVSPAAMAKLIHPDGELAIARACEHKGIFQGVSLSLSQSQTLAYHLTTSAGLQQFLLSSRGASECCPLGKFLLPTVCEPGSREIRRPSPPMLCQPQHQSHLRHGGCRLAGEAGSR